MKTQDQGREMIQNLKQHSAVQDFMVMFTEGFMT